VIFGSVGAPIAVGNGCSAETTGSVATVALTVLTRSPRVSIALAPRDDRSDLVEGCIPSASKMGFRRNLARADTSLNPDSFG
jgi:hypothetical protein